MKEFHFTYRKGEDIEKILNIEKSMDTSLVQRELQTKTLSLNPDGKG